MAARRRARRRMARTGGAQRPATARGRRRDATAVRGRDGSRLRRDDRDRRGRGDPRHPVAARGHEAVDERAARQLTQDEKAARAMRARAPAPDDEPAPVLPRLRLSVACAGRGASRCLQPSASQPGWPGQPPSAAPEWPAPRLSRGARASRELPTVGGSGPCRRRRTPPCSATPSRRVRAYRVWAVTYRSAASKPSSTSAHGSGWKAGCGRASLAPPTQEREA